jgi:hypothetical protein
MEPVKPVEGKSRTVPSEILDMLKNYRDAEKSLSSQIRQLELTIQDKRITYEKEISALTNNMQQLITRFNAVVGGITALNDAAVKLG